MAEICPKCGGVIPDMMTDHSLEDCNYHYKYEEQPNNKKEIEE